MTWQMLHADHWIFGKMVRGIVRDPLASLMRHGYGDTWHWQAQDSFGRGSFLDSINQAEEALDQQGLLEYKP